MRRRRRRRWVSAGSSTGRWPDSERSSAGRGRACRQASTAVPLQPLHPLIAPQPTLQGPSPGPGGRGEASSSRVPGSSPHPRSLLADRAPPVRVVSAWTAHGLWSLCTPSTPCQGKEVRAGPHRAREGRIAVPRMCPLGWGGAPAPSGGSPALPLSAAFFAAACLAASLPHLPCSALITGPALPRPAVSLCVCLFLSPSPLLQTPAGPQT